MSRASTARPQTPASSTSGSARPVSRSIQRRVRAVQFGQGRQRQRPGHDRGGLGAAGEVGLHGRVAAACGLADRGTRRRGSRRRRRTGTRSAATSRWSRRTGWRGWHWRGRAPAAMAPTTVPMKNGVSSEEKANVAPAARCRLSREIPCGTRSPAPRSTIPADGEPQRQRDSGHHRGERVREGGPEDDQREDEPDVVGLPHRRDRLIDQIAWRSPAPVAAGQQIPQAAAEVGAAQDGVEGDRRPAGWPQPRRRPS